MRIIRGIALVLGLLVLGGGALVIAARFADGPLAVLPGGPFKTGDWVEAPDVDWSFAGDLEEIELQSGDPVRSRTVWLVVHEGEAYVPASLEFPPGKTWHEEALEEPEAVVRVEGKRYRRRLQRVDEEPLGSTIRDLLREKYGAGPGGESGRIWVFHLASPSA